MNKSPGESSDKDDPIPIISNTWHDKYLIFSYCNVITNNTIYNNIEYGICYR